MMSWVEVFGIKKSQGGGRGNFGLKMKCSVLDRTVRRVSGDDKLAPTFGAVLRRLKQA